jgi:hypothetical protein
MSEHLSGLRFVLTGLFDSPRREIKQHLEAVGAKVTGSVSSKTSALIAGEDGGSKVEKARLQNIPILNEEDLKLLLDGKTLEETLTLKEAPVVEVVSLEENFSRFREALLEGPTHQAWNQLIVLLDETPEEQRALVVDYLEQHLAAWEGRKNLGWTTEHYYQSFQESFHKDEPLSGFWKLLPDVKWMYSFDEHELRCAPYHWLEEMIQGVNHPHWRLVRYLQLDSLKLSGKQASQLLTLPDLNKVEVLSFINCKKLPGTFFKKLLKHPEMSSLKCLRFGTLINPTAIKAFQEEAVFSLERLGLFDGPGIEVEQLQLLLSSPSFQTVTELALLHERIETNWVTVFRENPELLPKLTSLSQTIFHHEESVQTLIESGLLPRLESLKFGLTHYDAGAWSTLFQAEHLPSLQHLDLQGVNEAKEWGYSLEEIEEELLSALDSSALDRQLKTVRLGKDGFPRLRSLCRKLEIVVDEGEIA